MKKTLGPEQKRMQIDQDFKWVEKVSWLMDNQFQVGNARFGLDPLLNLIPFGGSVVTFSTSLVLVFVMWRNGVSSKAVVKMLINVMVDTILGAIPFLGNIFDFFNKANQKNVKILKEHYYDGKHQGSGIWLLLLVLGILILICILMVYLLWIATAWFFSLLF